MKKIGKLSPQAQADKVKRCEAMLVTLGVNKDAWLKTITTDDQKRQAEEAIRFLFQKVQTTVTLNELKTRGVVLDDLCQGSWVLVRSGRNNISLAVIMHEMSPNRKYKIWFGDDTIEMIEAINIWQHLTDHYPAPIALNGKTVLPKAKLQYKQIEEALLKNSK